jgi:hypothetical protein
MISSRFTVVSWGIMPLYLKGQGQKVRLFDLCRLPFTVYFIIKRRVIKEFGIFFGETLVYETAIKSRTI